MMMMMMMWVMMMMMMTMMMMTMMMMMWIMMMMTMMMMMTVFAKTAGLSDKTGKFSFCPAENFTLSDKCPVILAKRDSNLITGKPPVLQNFSLFCQKLQSV